MKKEFISIKSLLKKGKTALVASHLDPDGDAIGSMLALGMILERLGLSTTLYCTDHVPKIYRFLPTVDKVKKTLSPLQHFDYAFIVDSSDISRIGDKINLRHLATVIINIDHHPDNTGFGDINYVRSASCVAEQVFDLCQYLKVKIDQNIANCLYTAMITDTGNFRYENTSVKTFLVAAELLKAGVNTHSLTTRIYDNKSIPSIKICALALAQVRFSPDRKIAWTAITEKMMQETQAEGEDLIGIVDKLRSIEGVEVAVLFREKERKIKINFRSKEKINISEIAKHFGGGGHFKAAGAIIEGESGKIEEQVIGEVQKHVRAASFLV